MKFRIDGKHGGKPAWLTWEDGIIDGSPDVVMHLNVLDDALADRPIGMEYFKIDNPDAKASFLEPFRVFHLCVDPCYGVGPVFDFDTPKYDMSEIIAAQPERPAGAV